MEGLPEGHKVSPLRNFIAGGFGGICMVICGYPFDTLKVRLQVNPIQADGQRLYRGLVHCAVKSLKSEGIRGFYRGMLAPVTTATPMNAFAFWGFSVGMKLQGAMDPNVATMRELFLAGCLSGACYATVAAPSDRIKCLCQTQKTVNLAAKAPTRNYKGAFDCAINVYRQEGLRSIFRGWNATLIRDIPSSGFFFITYHGVMRVFPSKEDDTRLLIQNEDGDSNPAVKTMQILIAGGLAGCANWIVALPIDVLKTRYQSAETGTYPRGLRDVFPFLMKTEGVKGLFKGIVPLMCGSFTANAACFLGVEIAMDVMALNFPGEEAEFPYTD